LERLFVVSYATMMSAVEGKQLLRYISPSIPQNVREQRILSGSQYKSQLLLSFQ